MIYWKDRFAIQDLKDLIKNFMNSYKSLTTQTFELGKFKIVPIRYEDRLDIMKWRNEQIYHLRQKEILTQDDQDRYFKIVVSKLFDQKAPNQLLFSYLENDKCIGYGGLVHMNWIDKNAEISFIMKTELEKNDFSKHWEIYLKLIERVAFEELKFHKIFTYAFDIRPKLYDVLNIVLFNEEARLKGHCLFDGKFIDVVIHSKFNDNATL